MKTDKYKLNIKANISKDQFYDLRIGTRLSDGNGLACSSSLISFANDGGGGSATVLSQELLGVRNPPITILRGHSGGITDICFSPFKPNILATSSEDKMIKIWKIPEEGEYLDMLKSKNLSDNKMNMKSQFIDYVDESYTNLVGHSKRCSLISFNNTAEGILASLGMDKIINIWDLNTEKVEFSFSGINSLCYDLKWSYNGQLLSLTSANKNINIIDPRKNSVVKQFIGHPGSRIGKVSWLDDNEHLVSTGFNKYGVRSIKLWDLRNIQDPVNEIELDIMSSTLLTNYDNDFNLLTIFGKGDGNIRIFDYDSKGLNLIQEFRTTDPQRGICFYPNRCLDFNNNQIMKIFKSVGTDSIDLIKFNVVGQPGLLFDHYTTCFSGTPALKSNEWKAGKTSFPNIVSIKDLEPVKQRESKLIEEEGDDNNLIRRKTARNMISRLSSVISFGKRSSKVDVTPKNSLVKDVENEKEHDSLNIRMFSNLSDKKQLIQKKSIDSNKEISRISSTINSIKESLGKPVGLDYNYGYLLDHDDEVTSKYNTNINQNNVKDQKKIEKRTSLRNSIKSKKYINQINNDVICTRDDIVQVSTTIVDTVIDKINAVSKFVNNEMDKYNCVVCDTNNIENLVTNYRNHLNNHKLLKDYVGINDDSQILYITSTLKMDLIYATERIEQLEKILEKSNSQVNNPTKGMDNIDTDLVKLQEEKMKALQDEYSKLSMKYHELNNTYAQQTALFALYKEFYADLEDVVCENFANMKETVFSR